MKNDIQNNCHHTAVVHPYEHLWWLLKIMSILSKRMLFAYLVFEIDISKYKQKEYAKLVKSIYYNIFGKEKKKNK